MKKHSFLSHAKGAHLFAGKLFLIITAVLSATIWTQAQSPVDLRISSISNFSSVRLGSGQDIVFHIPVYIESRRQASGVVVTAELPAGVTFLLVKTDTGTCGFADNLITCNLGVVGREGMQAMDWVAYIQIFVKPIEVGTVSLTARITASEADPNLANNTTTRTVTVIPPKSRKRVRFF
jgi:hypothetical protein